MITRHRSKYFIFVGYLDPSMSRELSLAYFFCNTRKQFVLFIKVKKGNWFWRGVMCVNNIKKVWLVNFRQSKHLDEMCICLKGITHLLLFPDKKSSKRKHWPILFFLSRILFLDFLCYSNTNSIQAAILSLKAEKRNSFENFRSKSN